MHGNSEVDIKYTLINKGAILPLFTVRRTDEFYYCHAHF